MSSAIRCDQCCRFADAGPFAYSGYPERGLPENWLRVIVIDKENIGQSESTVNAEFCSFTCAGHYLVDKGRDRA